HIRDPAQSAIPFDQGGPKVERRCLGRNGQSPEWPLLEKIMGLVAQAVPERGGVGQGFAPYPERSAAHRWLAARYPHVQLPRLARFARPGSSSNGYGQTSPRAKQLERLRFGDIQPEAGLLKRLGHNFDGDLDQGAEDSHGTGQQARNVIARHILHDLAAKAQDFARGVQQLGPQNEVAYVTGRHAPWPRKAAGDTTAYGRGWPKARRLKGQHLILFIERGLDIGQQRSGP